jgi:CshA-type fibril repeat protein
LRVTQFQVAGSTYTPSETPQTIPGAGSLTLRADGSYTFTPQADFHGDVPVIAYTITDLAGATSTATLSLTVTPVNDAPVATNDTATTPEDTTVSGNVMGNDSDVDGDLMTVTGFTVAGSTYAPSETPQTIPGAGTLILRADGSYTFTPQAGFNGDVPVITYTVSDAGGLSASASLALTLEPATAVPVPLSASASGLLIPPPSAQPIVLEPPTGLHIPQVFDSALYPQRASMSMAVTYMIEQFDGQPARLVRDMALWVVDDSYTEAPANQWRVAVHPDIRSEITVWRGVRDHVIESYDVAYLSIPWDSFSHTHSDAQVSLEATLADGNPLPPWMNLDSRFGVFELVPPPQFQGELAIRLMARDTEGRVAATVFRIQVRERGLALGDGAIPIGRTSLNEQLRDATRQRTSSAPSFPSNPS